jgi:glycosyltransferase involved in cell wall biosynthesis
MNVLMLNTYDITGGAARATFRLHEALLRSGVDAKMLVAYKRSQASTVIAASPGARGKASMAARAFLDRLLVKKYPLVKNSKWGPFSPARVRNRGLVNTVNAINPDIVHLCWICHGMMAVEDLADIRAPIVYRLPDMWAFTGGCHYAADGNGANAMCDKYISGCGRCGLLGSDNAKDLSFCVFERKRRAFHKIRGMTVVGVSRWLADCAGRSALFADKKIVCLPNPVDTDVFKPVDKLLSRRLWNLPSDKKLILFGAIDAVSTPYKGYDLLASALNKILPNNVECIVFGASEPKEKPRLLHKIRYVGHLSDDVSLASLYGACDVTVVPSRREAFGQTASESLACGTPVAAFGVGGLLDIVGHKKCGYLARPFDTSDLAYGIDWILNSGDYSKLSAAAREKAVGEYGYGVVAEKYINIYKHILGKE